MAGIPHIKCQKRYYPNKLIVPYEYKGIARSCIIKSKFNPKAFSLVNSLIDYLLVYAEQFDLNQIDNSYIVTSVPCDKKRLAQRGFNLPTIIASSLAKKLNLNYKDLLVKNNLVIPFEHLKRKQRFLAIKNAFLFSSKIIPKKVILVDDVITTGATLIEATKTLKKSGVKEVVVFALCFKPYNNTNYSN